MPSKSSVELEKLISECLEKKGKQLSIDLPKLKIKFVKIPNLMNTFSGFLKYSKLRILLRQEKSEKEPLKILGRIENGKLTDDDSIKISAHCNRVPVQDGHTACASIKFGDRKRPEKRYFTCGVVSSLYLKN
jgi:hypothetical protein